MLRRIRDKIERELNAIVQHCHGSEQHPEFVRIPPTGELAAPSLPQGSAQHVIVRLSHFLDLESNTVRPAGRPRLQGPNNKVQFAGRQPYSYVTAQPDDSFSAPEMTCVRGSAKTVARAHRHHHASENSPTIRLQIV